MNKTHHYQNFIYAIDKKDIENVRRLLPFVDPKMDESMALYKAVGGNDTNLVKLLLPLSDPKAYGSRALKEAVRHQYMEIFHLLLPVSDVKSGKNSIFSTAAYRGNLEIFQTLLPLSRPEADDFDALLCAVRGGHRDIVQRLLPFGCGERTILLSEAVSSSKNSTEFLDLIYPLCKMEDVKTVVHGFEQWRIPPKNLFYLKDILKAEETKNFLHENISNNKSTMKPKKI